MLTGRDVKSDARAYGLAVRAEDGKLANFMILRASGSEKGFFIKGAQGDVFPTLFDLVQFYANRKRAILGVQLRLPVEDPVSPPAPAAVCAACLYFIASHFYCS